MNVLDLIGFQCDRPQPTNTTDGILIASKAEHELLCRREHILSIPVDPPSPRGQAVNTPP